MTQFNKTDYNELKKIADSGNAEAQLELGIRLYNGLDGAPLNKSEGVSYYQKSYSKGNMEAAWRLGDAYIKGEGVSKNPDMGQGLLRKAAEAGLARAEALLGMSYLNEDCPNIDIDKGVHWINKAARNHDIIGETLYANLLYNGIGVSENIKESFKWKKIAATTHEDENEDALSLAQYHLALAYQDGDGVKPDYAEAVKWYMKAAEGGMPEAQRKIGQCYLDGHGLPKDIHKSIYWFEKSASQGDHIAQSFLSVIYRYSDQLGYNEIEIDTELALDYIIQGAENNNPVMQSELGARLITGVGIARNIEKGMYWLSKAADGGNASAMYNLGYLYYQGEDIPRDDEQAAFWLKECTAHKGEPKAKTLLALMYWDGRYFEKDIEKALELLDEAKNEGCELAADFFNSFNSKNKSSSSSNKSTSVPTRTSSISSYDSSSATPKKHKTLKAVVVILVLLTAVVLAYNPVKNFIEDSIKEPAIVIDRTETTTSQEQAPYYIKAADCRRINIRSGPGMDRSVITLVGSDKVKMYPTGKTSGEWIEVEAKEFGTAWVSSTVVTYIEP